MGQRERISAGAAAPAARDYRGVVTEKQLPLTERGRRSRLAIVDAAATSMYEHGVCATGLDDILTAAGCGKSQLYHYFESRSDLVRAVIERQLDYILSYQPAIEQADSWAGLRRWADQLLSRHDHGEPFACTLGSIAAELKNDDEYLPSLRAAFQRWEEPLARGLEAMRLRGQLSRRSDPSRLARSTIAALQGGMLLAHIHDDPTVFRDAVENALLSLRRRAIPRRRNTTY